MKQIVAGKGYEKNNGSSLGEELYHLENERERSKSNFRTSQQGLFYVQENSAGKYFTFAKLLLVFLFVLVGIVFLNPFGLFSLENKLTGTSVLADGSHQEGNPLQEFSFSSVLMLAVSFLVVAVFSLYNLSTYLDIKSKLKNRIKIS